jgi:uroporphyrinogen decarboxylase
MPFLNSAGRGGVSLTRRERVIKSLDHCQPDKVPYHLEFTAPAREKLARWCGDSGFEKSLGSCLLVLSTETTGSGREVRPNVWEDQFGVEWDRSIDTDIGNVCNRPITKENLAAYPFPDPDDPSRFSDYRRLIAAEKELFVVANLGFSLFERAWTLAGMEEVLMAMASYSDFVHSLLDRILQFNLRIIANTCAFPIDAMLFGDDWGHQGGIIMGPDLWREFIKPCIRQMYALAKSKGRRAFIHSCGKVDALLPDLIECGLDCFNPFQPEVMDVLEMKRKYGDSLSFYGGISTQKTLPFGTVGQVKDEVRRLIDHVGKEGGYIASPAHAVPKDAKPENVAAMIEALQEQ